MVTVKELIQWLEQQDPEAIVVTSEEGNTYEIDKNDLRAGKMYYYDTNTTVNCVRIE